MTKETIDELTSILNTNRKVAEALHSSVNEALYDLLTKNGRYILVYYDPKPVDNIIIPPQVLAFNTIKKFIDYTNYVVPNKDKLFLQEYKRNINYIHEQLIKVNLNIKKGQSTFTDTEGRRNLENTLQVFNSRTLSAIETYLTVLATETKETK